MPSTAISNLVVNEAGVFFSQVCKAATSLMSNPAGVELVQIFRSLPNVSVAEVTPEHGAHFDPILNTIYWKDEGFAPEGAKMEKNKECIYPSWVVLAHEMGHAIQFAESKLTGPLWFQLYCDSQEAVEQDNIRRHEWPIVRSLGMFVRLAYTDPGMKDMRAFRSKFKKEILAGAKKMGSAA